MAKYLMVLMVAVALLFSAPSLGVAAGSATGSAKDTTSDAAISIKVKAKLADEVSLKSLATIEINTTNGVVTLAGTVDTAEQRLHAERLARSVDGVIKVNNALQLCPCGEHA